MMHRDNMDVATVDIAGHLLSPLDNTSSRLVMDQPTCEFFFSKKTSAVLLLPNAGLVLNQSRLLCPVRRPFIRNPHIPAE